MKKVIDLIGQKFGRLIVIKKVDRDKWGNLMWLCKCDCGKEKIIVDYDLKNTHTQSCGCLKKFPSGVAMMRKAIRAYKNNAKKYGRNFDLTEEQFKELTQQDCYYCGMKPNNIIKQPRSNGNYIYNGLDRIDNSKGYTIDNIVSRCGICNFAKHNLTSQEFKDWVKRIYNKMFG